MAYIFSVFSSVCLLYVSFALCAPTNDNQAFVVSSSTTARSKHEKEGKSFVTYKTPQIYQMRIQSDISNRYANTTITSKVRNFANKAQEAVFSVVLPESAFISGFIMEIGGVNYTAYVKGKEEAKQIYDEAVLSGTAAAHVAVSARDSNKFSVSVNVESEAKAAFYLTYEQLLKRQNGHYEQIINIHPGQQVKDLSVEILIAESRKLVNVKAPPLRSGNEITTDKDELDPRADITVINDTSAVIQFSPNVERQKELAHIFGNDVENGLSGQFVVQYDVERDPKGGEVLVQDGYFVHFFAPDKLNPLPKQVVFVLDTSGSMWGLKIQQVKEAMNKILEQLNEQDTLNLVEFNSNTKVWNLDNPDESVWYPRTNNYYDHETRPELELKNVKFPRAYPANAGNIKKAKQAVSKLNSDGSTSMYGALEIALHLIELERTQTKDHVNRQPIVVFLTDGEPTDTSTHQIMTNITELNTGPRKAPIFSLSFGEGADTNFLQTFSLRNSGFCRYIYEASDASLQLQDFYRQISSPLLSNVKFKYEKSATSLTRTDFPIHFGGSEIVVAGWCGTDLLEPVVDGYGVNGDVSLNPVISKSISNIERLWAYLTINQLLEKKETSDKPEEIKQKALDLALKYSFVTPLSSLVVVKPNNSRTVNAEEARPLRIDHESGLIDLRIGSDDDYPAFPKLSHPMLALSAVPDTRYSLHDSLLFEDEYETEVYTTNIPESKLDVLLQNLPWLSTILNDGYITFSNSTYKLGEDETISDSVKCKKTPFGEEGHCTLLYECPQVHSILTSSKHFFDHFCILRNEYAGVCCPNDSDT